MKRKILHALSFSFILSLLIACGEGSSSLSTSTDGSSSSTSSFNYPEEPSMDYEEIYHHEVPEPYPLTPSKGRYVAHQGYHLMHTQGYNHWFYVDSVGSQLEFQNESKRWETAGGYFLDEVMHVSGSTLSRKFVSPDSGTALISGQIKSVGGASPTHFQVTLNGTLMSEGEVEDSDTIGIFHSRSVSLIEGDIVLFSISSEDGTVAWNPSIDFTGASPSVLHITQPNGSFFGDVHPFYDHESRKMFMYYLDTNGHYDSRLITSSDMLHYSSELLKTDPIDPPAQDNYYVLGVYRDGPLYRTYFGLGDGYGSAESTDLRTWKNAIDVDPQFRIGGKAFFDYDNFPGGGRDPYAFLDVDVERTRIIGMAYKSYPANRSMVLYTSSDPSGRYFTDKPIELLSFPNAGDGDPECSMASKIGTRWYLFTSRYGHSAHGVGRLSYWIGDPNTRIDQVNWKAKTEQHLDGEDLIAAQLTNVGGHYYVYGWMPQTWNGSNWGGVLNLPREIVQFADGTLGSRIDPKLSSLLKKGIDPAFEGIASRTNFGLVRGVPTSSSADASLTLAGSFTRSFIESDFTFPTASGRAGYTLKQGSAIYDAVVTRNTTNTILSFGKRGESHNPVASLTLPGVLNEVNLKLVIEGPNAILSVNDAYSLTIRSGFLLDVPFSLSLFSTIVGTQVNQAKVFRLANADNIYE